MHRMRLRATLLALVISCAAPSLAGAEESTKLQVGSALASVLYAPAKVAYAAVGAVFGGIAWGLSGGRDDVMQAVVDPAIHGDYLVTPEHLRGERDIEFVGEAPGAAEPEQTAADYPYSYYDDDGYYRNPAGAN